MQLLLKWGIFSLVLDQPVGPYACPCPYQEAGRTLVGLKVYDAFLRNYKVQSPGLDKVGDRASLDLGTAPVPVPVLGLVQGCLRVEEADLPSR